MDDEDRLTRVEYAIFGVRGDNGLVSEFRAFRNEIAEWRREEKARVEAAARERKLEMRFRITTTIAVIMAILAAAAIVAGAL